MNILETKIFASLNNRVKSLMGTILVLFIFASTVTYGEEEPSKNLLKPWKDDQPFSTEIEVKNSIVQKVVLDQEEATPIFFSAESKAEEATGKKNAYYSIFLNITYTDGTKKNGVNCPFNPGTHDWEKAEKSFTPEKPIKELNFYILFRDRPGRIWVRNTLLTEEPVVPEVE